MMKKSNFEIIDAHTHFFSYTWLKHFYELAREQFDPSKGVAALAERLGWEMPPTDPRDLGKRWLQELDKYGVARQVLFASKLNDAEYLTAAVREFPNRLIGYVMVDPTHSEARSLTHYSLNILDMKGILLFPAMHHFHANSKTIYQVYEEAVSAAVPVFIHFGNLSIPIFGKLGLDANIKLEYSNPLDLKAVAKDFSDVNFIIPHFGCGRFEEALQVAAEFENVYFDTSSSNSWIKAPLTLQKVFEKSLDVLGPERLLFGTDSSFFPRGWRHDIFEVQSKILEDLHLSEKAKALILGGNIARILQIK